jgi:hypothetical protein
VTADFVDGNSVVVKLRREPSLRILLDHRHGEFHLVSYEMVFLALVVLLDGKGPEVCAACRRECGRGEMKKAVHDSMDRLPCFIRWWIVTVHQHELLRLHATAGLDPIEVHATGEIGSVELDLVVAGVEVAVCQFRVLYCPSGLHWRQRAGSCLHPRRDRRLLRPACR